MNDKSYPQLETASLDALAKALALLNDGFAGLPEHASAWGYPGADFAAVLDTVAARMHDNYPYFHPLYAGQMLKPPHPVARAAYALAMWINPNNHALDGGRASSAMEKEAVGEIARMFGWDNHLGHLCGGGTIANLEALWVAGQLYPGKVVLASEQAHYTHERISKVLGLRFEAVSCDNRGRMDAEKLRVRLARGDVGTIVATLGTTATGAVDPLPAILALRDIYDFHLHADAAYGGYFCLTSNLDDEARATFDRVGEADSIVIDPHKHGLQPYGCGCVLFQDPSVGRFYKHDSPYTYFSSDSLHLGEISMECSRPGAAAVALWATQQLLPLATGGDFADMLENSRSAALALHKKLQRDDRFVTAFAPELDIVVWVPHATSANEASRKSRAIFDFAGEQDLHLALAKMPSRFFDLAGNSMRADSETITCLRSVLMKAEHLEWIEEIWKRLCAASDQAG